MTTKPLTAKQDSVKVNGRDVPWEVFLRLTGRERAPDGTIRDLPNWRNVVCANRAERGRLFGRGDAR